MSYSRKGDELLEKLGELNEIFSLGEITEDEYKQQSSELQLQIDNLSILEDDLERSRILKWQKEGLEKVEERIRLANKGKSLKDWAREFDLMNKHADY